MDIVCAFFTTHMVVIFFLYGLAFFVTGIVVWLEASRSSALPLAQTLPFLAAFGLIHGTHEWLEMFEMLASPPVGLLPRLFRLFVLVVSFIPLVEFGLHLLTLRGEERWRWLRWGLLAIFLAGVGLIWSRWGSEGRAWIAAIDAWCRYCLAVPGTVLTAVGLCRYCCCLSGPETRFSKELRIVGLAFLLYGIPGQIFVGSSPLPPSTFINAELFMGTLHFPVQLLRTIMASLVALFTVRTLRIFEVERERQMEKLNRARLEAQRQLTEEVAEREALQRELLHRTVQVQEEERRHIARELHDEVGQALTAISYGLVAVEEAVSGCCEETQERVAELRGLLEDVMEKLHQLTTLLRPTMLDELGLIPALITYADDVSERFAFTADVKVTGQRQRLSSETEIALYRIVQEALTNVAKHAQATHADVQLHFDERELTLSVSDDGVGMDVERARSAAACGEGWGLAGIRERTQLVNGELDIRSSPDAGTDIIVHVPIPEHDAQEENTDAPNPVAVGG